MWFLLFLIGAVFANECPSGYSGPQCQNPVCSKNSLILQHPPIAEVQEQIAYFTSLLCSDKFTFSVDSTVSNLFVGIAGNATVKVTDPSGSPIASCGQFPIGAQSFSEYCNVTAGEYTVQMTATGQGGCSLSIHAATSFSLDGGFVPSPQDDKVQYFEPTPGQGVGRNPVELVPSFFAFSLHSAPYPTQPFSVAYLKAATGEKMIEQDVIMRYHCSAPFITESPFMCVTGMEYYVQVMGSDSLGFTWQRVYPFRCDDKRTAASKHVMGSVDGENIKRILRRVTAAPHQAGTPANARVADMIVEEWKTAGLEDVHLLNYNVLLNYPSMADPNHVSISQFGREVFRSAGISPALLASEQAQDAGIQWLAYSPPGDVTGDLIYAGSGTDADFEQLAKMGVNVTGRIALMRYGTGFRGDKVRAAQLRGCSAAILFSDPAEVAVDGTDKAQQYPSTVWMPEEGVQRGSIMHQHGDPLTPLYPARADIFQTRTEQQAVDDGLIPKIPAVPVSYSTAYELLSRMGGEEAPHQWQGGINVTYRVGPSMVNGAQVRVEVHSKNEERPIRNVIGYIRGATYPDRYVILGNHYDAWVYGSVDPNSGTAALAEVARAMMQTANETGWRPERTIVFAAWDAEEYGLMGSTEFCEEFTAQLQQRAVAYVNMDCLQGNMSLFVDTTPTMFDVVIDAARDVPNPVESERADGRLTAYDTWVAAFPHGDGRPDMPVPAASSDHSPFQNYLGVPVVNFVFRNTTSLTHTYPLYHSMYETPFLNEHLMDDAKFSVHVATARFWSALALRLSDPRILPVRPSQLARSLQTEYLPELKNTVDKVKNDPELAPAMTQLAFFEENMQDLHDSAVAFEQKIAAWNGKTPDSEWFNDRLMQVDRCLIDPRGMDTAPQKRHVLFSVSDRNSYAGRVFAAVYDALDDYDSSNVTVKAEVGRTVAAKISIVQYSIICATHAMQDFL